MNFFNKECQVVINETEFGLCDDKDKESAYINVDTPNNWIATIKNESNLDLTFTAIDKCVIKDNEELDRGRCDGMLTTGQHIYFVELNDTGKRWITKAINQLESTIKFFKENHDFSSYRHKKAFACNREHRRFQEVDNELNLRFFRTYGFRIDIQAEIIVI